MCRPIVGIISNYNHNYLFGSSAMCKDLCKLADDGKPAKFIRMDNSGENKKFVERAESSDWKLNLV